MLPSFSFPTNFSSLAQIQSSLISILRIYCGTALSLLRKTWLHLIILLLHNPFLLLIQPRPRSCPTRLFSNCYHHNRLLLHFRLLRFSNHRHPHHYNHCHILRAIIIYSTLRLCTYLLIRITVRKINGILTLIPLSEVQTTISLFHQTHLTSIVI